MVSRSTVPDWISRSEFKGEREASEAIPVNIFISTSTNHFIGREGEAPAEPSRRRFGRSLALPILFNRLKTTKMFTWVASPSRLD